jgi:hypothetical protein
MNAEDIVHILSDPRPEEPDTKRWRCALLLVHRVVLDRSRAVELASRLWTMRQIGASLKPDRAGLKFLYLPGQWTDEAEFEAFKTRALGEFRNEVIELLNRVERVVDKQEVPEEWNVYA